MKSQAGKRRIREHLISALRVLQTRTFLDLRGLLEGAEFDTFMQRTDKPA